jgi:hypothetical protein
MNKVRFGEDAETSTRDACAPQSAKSAQSAVGNLLDDLEGPSGGRIVAEVFIGLLLRPILFSFTRPIVETVEGVRHNRAQIRNG